MNRILVILGLVSLCACKNEQKIECPIPNYQLTWNDEFEDSTLNLEKWAIRTDNKHQSIQLKDNVSLNGGALVLDLKTFKEPVKGKLASGAGIVTKQRFKYGYYEVRAKLGDGFDNDQDGKIDEGWHHSFWAMAASIDEKGEVNTTYPGIRRTEIDCYENPTEHIYEPEQNGLNNFSQHVIVWNETGHETSRLPKPPTDVLNLENFNANDWHTYGFEWTNEHINFYVDGQITKIALYPVDQYVHDDINVWLTAIAASWNNTDQEKSEAKYDYFRFFKKLE